MLRRWSLKLHRWVGLIAGLPIAVIGITGSLLVYRGALDRFVHPNLYEVSSPAAEVSVTPGEALRRARTENPDSEPVTIEFPDGPDEPYVIWHAAERAAEKTYVDPTTGSLLGVRPEGSDPVRTLFDLHVDLLTGSSGTVAVGVLGLLLLLASITGVVVWWPRAGRWLEAITVRFGSSSQRMNYDLHRAGGFWTLLYLSILALTGTGLVFYGTTGDLLNRATGSSPPPGPPSSSPPPPEATQAGPGLITPERIDRAWHALRERAPEGEVTFASLPAEPRAPVSLRFRLPSELHPVGRSFAYADRWTGELLRVDRQPEMDPGPRMLHTLYPLHVGDFRLGPLPPEVMRALWALLGLSPAGLLVTGAIVWWLRGGNGTVKNAAGKGR